jgi:hypothetical protein
MRAIALGLIGTDYKALRLDLSKWIQYNKDNFIIEIDYTKHSLDYPQSKKNITTTYHLGFKIKKDISNGDYPLFEDVSKPTTGKDAAVSLIWGAKKGWFSAGFGAFRRFTGGDKEWEKMYAADPRVAAHLSLFGEDVALTEILTWLEEQDYKKLEGDDEAGYLLDNIKLFFNNSKLLPHNTKLDKISSKGVFFTDGNGTYIDVIGLSDGFRSILSLTFELIRQLIRVYGAKEVFKNFSKDNYSIDLQGVVLIDEIDVHLHPTWQTRIGEWFIKYFPNLQFIVATHSPLICRACHTGTIWRLSAPGSDIKSAEITGIDKDRLVYGNVLDAYGTEVFGQNVTRSQKAHEQLNRLARLNMLHTVGKISEEEKIEMYHLRQIFTTDDTTNF